MTADTATTDATDTDAPEAIADSDSAVDFSADTEDVVPPDVLDDVGPTPDADPNVPDATGPDDVVVVGEVAADASSDVPPDETPGDGAGSEGPIDSEPLDMESMTPDTPSADAPPSDTPLSDTPPDVPNDDSSEVDTGPDVNTSGCFAEPRFSGVGGGTLLSDVTEGTVPGTLLGAPWTSLAELSLPVLDATSNGASPSIRLEATASAAIETGAAANFGAAARATVRFLIFIDDPFSPGNNVERAEIRLVGTNGTSGVVLSSAVIHPSNAGTTVAILGARTWVDVAFHAGPTGTWTCAGGGASVAGPSLGTITGIEISMQYIGNPTPLTGAAVLIDDLRVFVPTQ
jgi:hypothetical protein